MMIVTHNKGDHMNESVQEFLNRGGQVTICKPMKAHGAQKKQTIKCPNSFSLGRKVFTVGCASKGVSRADGQYAKQVK
jgi:hypothetical protein